jgi:hypothetical protein
MSTTLIDIPQERFGPYVLQSLIGRGGMGEVHRAVDTAHDGRVVAVKLLPRELSDDRERRARFRREAEIVAGLGDPHVIPVHGYGEIDGRLYLDMQLVEGPDLGGYLATGGPMPPELTAAIVEQVAAALDAAHAAGLVHHDVKPSNVLVHRPQPGAVPHVVLADFGIAGDAAGLGTVEYLAPERIRGLGGDRRVDVYALACMAFEMLTGARVFGGDFPAQVHGHLHLPPPPPSSLVPALPPALDAAVVRGLAKDPGARPSTAGAFAAEVRAAITRGRRPSRRQFLVAAAAGALTVAAGIAVAPATRRDDAPSATTAGPLAAPEVSPFGSGPAPQPVITERALGVRSFENTPFAVAAAGGTLVAAVLNADGFQCWDLVADAALGPVLSRDVIDGIATDLMGVAVIDVDGTPVLCSAAYDEPTVVLRDVPSGLPLGRSIAPTGAAVDALTAAVIDGVPVLLSVDENKLLARNDLRTGAQLGPPVPAPDMGFVTNIRLDGASGRQFLLSWDGEDLLTENVRDARTLERIGRHGSVGAVVTELDGVPVTIGTAGEVVVRDLASGAEVRRIAAEVTTPATATVLDGRLIVAAVTPANEIQLFDVAAGTAIGSPLAGHEATVTALESVLLGDRPVLVSAGLEGSIRVWDVAVRAHG